MEKITIEQVEALAADVEATDAAERARLARLITAYARIVAVREPDKFKARATEYGDAGASDGSYPPDAEYRDKTGPRLIRIADFVWQWLATESGFYHAARAATTDPGMYVDRRGRLYGATITGTGRFAPFPAHPGYCDVQCSIAWDSISLADAPMDRLAQAEEKMRKLAFPLAAIAA